MTKNKNTKTSQIHIPVMSDKVLETLNPKRGEAYLDLTAGYGAHANQVLERTLELKKAVLVDRDQMAIDQLTEKFQGSGIRIIHKDFLDAARNSYKKNVRLI